MALRRPLVRILGKLRILPAEDKIPFSTVDELGTAAKADVTTSTLDTTSDRVLKPGDFSLGMAYNMQAELLPTFKSGSNLPTGAFYRALGAGTPTPTPGTPPGSGSSQMCVISLPAFGTDQFRHWIASENGGTAAARKLWWGQTNGPNTEYWSEIYHTDNIGTASVAYATRASTLSADTRRVMFPQGGAYIGTGPITGAIAVTIPMAFTQSMLSLTIRVFDYTTQASFEVHCGGYVYTDGKWYNPFANTISTPGKDDHVVRFGRTAAGNPVIYIGDLSTTWQYPQVFVTDVCSGFNAGVSDTGWAVAIVAAFSNVTGTIVNTGVGRRPLPATVSGSRALTIVDDSAYLRTTTAVTITVPTNATAALPVGAEVTIRAAQASGNTTIAAAAGVSLVAPSGGTLVLGPRMTVTLKKVGTDTWDVIGQTVPA